MKQREAAQRARGIVPNRQTIIHNVIAQNSMLFELQMEIQRRKLQKINHYADTHLNTFGYTTKDISNEDRQ